MATFDSLISVLYSTLDILVPNKEQILAIVSQTDTPFSDHMLFCMLISICTTS